MRPESPINNDWIDAALVAGDRAGAAFLPVLSLARVEPTVFSVLALLLGHGVIADGVAREALVLAMSGDAALRDRGRLPSTSGGLLRFAAQATGWPMRSRASGRGLRAR